MNFITSLKVILDEQNKEHSTNIIPLPSSHTLAIFTPSSRHPNAPMPSGNSAYWSHRSMAVLSINSALISASPNLGSVPNSQSSASSTLGPTPTTPTPVPSVILAPALTPSGPSSTPLTFLDDISIFHSQAKYLHTATAWSTQQLAPPVSPSVLPPHYFFTDIAYSLVPALASNADWAATEAILSTLNTVCHKKYIVPTDYKHCLYCVYIKGIFHIGLWALKDLLFLLYFLLKKIINITFLNNIISEFLISVNYLSAFTKKITTAGWFVLLSYNSAAIWDPSTIEEVAFRVHTAFTCYLAKSVSKTQFLIIYGVMS